MGKDKSANKTAQGSAHNFNDTPIEKAEQDLYGFAPFARAIADGIAGIREPVGTTIALNGEWGSGKSSILNLVKEDLKARKDLDITITDFKCWWYRGEEALALAFFDEIGKLLGKGLGKKVGDTLQALGGLLSIPVKIIGQVGAIATANSGVAAMADGAAKKLKIKPREKSLEELFDEIKTRLRKSKKRFLIIIDDMDRLEPDEALAIFKIIKSVGQLPNVLYLLAFDRAQADKAVAEKFPSEGPQFLEKIIQASFDVPWPDEYELEQATLASVQAICGDLSRDEKSRFSDTCMPFLERPRDVTRFLNGISFTWPAIGKEINRTDFLILEALRLYAPSVYNAIRDHRQEIDRIAEHYICKETGEYALNEFLGPSSGKNYERTCIAILKLFWGAVSRRNSESSDLDGIAQNRLFTTEHFDSYLRLSRGDGVLGADERKNLIERAGDGEFIKSELLKAAKQTRRAGGSRVPLYVMALKAHAREIPDKDVEPLLIALFEVADEVLPPWRQFGPGGSSCAPNHYMRLVERLVFETARIDESDGYAKRFTLEKRSAMFTNAMQSSSLVWKLFFAYRAKDYWRYHEQNNWEDEGKDCLVGKSTAVTMVSDALGMFRAEPVEAIFRNPHANSIIYFFSMNSAKDDTSYRDWFRSCLSDDQHVISVMRNLPHGSFLDLQRNPDNPVAIFLAPQFWSDEATGPDSENLFHKRLVGIRDNPETSKDDRAEVAALLIDWKKFDEAEAARLTGSLAPSHPA